MSKNARKNEGLAAQAQLAYRRVVAKVGTSLLTGGTAHLDLEFMGRIAGQMAELHSAGCEVLLVTSGAIAAGRDALGNASGEKDIPLRQVLAAVGQSRLMHIYEELFEAHGITVAQALITKGNLDDREGYLNIRNTLEALLSLRVVPIINENDMVDIAEIGEIVFGDNDNLSAMVANVVNADLLVILTDMDGLHTEDPRRNPEAKLISRVDRIDESIEGLAGGVGSEQGRGGMITKIQAARLATSSGVAVVVAGGKEPDVLVRLAQGESVGTLFVPTASKMESRKRWMMTGLAVRGSISLDDGAARALRDQNKSLLPAGISKIQGNFNRGDLVTLSNATGEPIGCGIVNYSAQELGKIRGHRSTEIQTILGYKYGDEVVHRNNLVVL